MKLFDYFFGRSKQEDKERLEDMRRELAHINSAMPLAIAERTRLKKNKKAHVWMDDLIKENRTRQLELEQELKV